MKPNLKSKLKAVELAATVSTMVLFGSMLQPQLHNSYLRYEVGTSVVQVLVGEGSGGTGFAVESASGHDYIATNKHVCEAAQTPGWVKIKSDGGLTAWKRIVYIDDRHDICLVEGDRRLDPLELAGAPSRGDLHYIVGHPGLRPLTVSTGEYVGFENVELFDMSITDRKACPGKIYELDEYEKMMSGLDWICLRSYKSYSSSAVAYGGNSGSPVVNKYGNVIGILFAGPRDQEHVSYLVPGYELQRVLNKF